MSQADIVNSMATRFDTLWNKGVTPIEWPNTPKKHASVPYVRFSVTFFDSENATIGALSVGSQINYSGLIVIGIFVKVNEGYGLSFSLANDVFDVFQNVMFDSIYTYAGTTIDVGKDPLDSNLYLINAQIPFESVS